MWIKNNNLIINSDHVVYIRLDGLDGTSISALTDQGFFCIGAFNTKKKAQEIFSNICQRLLTGDPNDQGIIIVNDKPKEVKKDASRKSNKRSNSKS